MITGLLFSTGSVFLNNFVFADDPWSDIAARQAAAEQKAMEKYMSYYQFANLDESKRNWSGLTMAPNSTTYAYLPGSVTDETSRGRDIPALEQLSLQNAVAQFDVIHIRQLANLSSDDYSGLVSTPTDMQGRDRNAMLENAYAISNVNADDVLGQLVKIQQNYFDFAPSTPTDTTATYDRQTMINQNMNTAESQAADLVSQLAKISGVYIDLSQYVNTNLPYTYKPGSITNEMTHGGRNLTPQEAYSLDKALMIFNQIHQTHLASLKSSYYGLTSTPTNMQGRDRNQMLAQAEQTSMDNAMRVYSSYYGLSSK